MSSRAMYCVSLRIDRKTLSGFNPANLCEQSPKLSTIQYKSSGTAPEGKSG
jgi:hypothetical protein